MSKNYVEFWTNQVMEDAGDNQKKGDCPFCGKEGHFYIHEDGSGWDCKHGECQKRGNIYTFLSQFHAECCNYEVDLLAQMRGIHRSHFKLNEIKYHPPTNVYCIPTYNKGKLNNLYKVWKGNDGKLVVYGTPGCSASLFNIPETLAPEVWLLEGHWDKLAGESIIGVKDIYPMGFPGTGFKNSWAEHLHGKKVVLFGDNDKAGQENNHRILKAIEKCPVKPINIKQIKWPNEATLPDGTKKVLPSKDKGDPSSYDVNDLHRDFGSKAYSWIQDNLVPCETEGNNLVIDNLITADPTCDSFEKLVDSCKTSYHFTEDMEHLLILLLASLYSLKVEGEQLWLRIMGAPGSSKTTLANILGASERSVMRDTFTGLLSGWKDDEATDASLIPLVANNALIIKDADALMTQPNITQILGEFRSFYDKNIAATYRHRVNIDYKNIRSVVQLNGTFVLRGIDNAALGDRFLDYEIAVSDDDRDKIADVMYDRSYQAAHTGLNPETKVLEHAKGFIDHHLMTWEGVAFLGDREKHIIKEYSKLSSYMRARVDRDKHGKVKHHPTPEVPSRLIGQFTKLYTCAPRIFNTTKVPSQVERVVKHVFRSVMDTRSTRFKICDALIKAPASSGPEIVEITKESHENVEREVKDMAVLGMLDWDKKRLDSNSSVLMFKLKENIHAQFTHLIDDK